jgi:hypothetical protein
MYSVAFCSVNQRSRSISGNSIWQPYRSGHSMLQTLLLNLAGPTSPLQAHTVTILPPACFTEPSCWKGPEASKFVSSPNSRIAVLSGCSSSLHSPFGMDLTPRSFVAQNGPPGWTSRTSTSPLVNRHIMRPALRFGILDKDRWRSTKQYRELVENSEPFHLKPPNWNSYVLTDTYRSLPEHSHEACLGYDRTLS